MKIQKYLKRHSVSGRSGVPPVPGVRQGRLMERARRFLLLIDAASRIGRYVRPMTNTGKSYPGEQAGPISIRMLADRYRLAAILLRDSGQRGYPISWAPFRLNAVQAIELYLSAFLLHSGSSAIEVRRMGHDLGARADAARAAGLTLRKRTYEHLVSLSASREYLVSRYSPDGLDFASQINRLAATLAEVTHKTGVASAAIPAKALG